MISTFTGIVTHTDTQMVRLALGPVSVELMVPDGSVFQATKEYTLYVALTWNQENGPALYGFANELDKKIFLLITSCSGIGPRIALAALGELQAQGFLLAIQAGDDRALSKVSGIGAKKAEQLIIQLKNKVSQLLASGFEIQGGEQLMHWQTVTEALTALNYSRSEVNNALAYLRGQQAAGSRSFDQLMRQALSFLSKQS